MCRAPSIAPAEGNRSKGISTQPLKIAFNPTQVASRQSHSESDPEAEPRLLRHRRGGVLGHTNPTPACDSLNVCDRCGGTAWKEGGNEASGCAACARATGSEE
jgi:hypothetical protein